MFAINISGQSLGAADFLDFVTEQIDATRVAPRKLCFEITETSAVSELAHALRFIDTLKALGCRFALDDFGTGLSSFSYLKSLPVDYLKIDGGFVKGLVADDIDQAMGRKFTIAIMGLKTIAEWWKTRRPVGKWRQNRCRLRPRDSLWGTRSPSKCTESHQSQLALDRPLGGIHTRKSDCKLSCPVPLAAKAATRLPHCLRMPNA
jgi:hypothetical protein